MIFDPNGNAPNTWLGPTAFLQTQFPTGDGNTHAWTLSAGSDHYAVVDETPANDETDYAYSETEGQIEQYTFPDLPAQVSSVVAAALVVQGQPYGEGSSFSIQPSVRVSSTDYLPVSAQDGPSSFNDTQFIIDEDPSTAAAWTISGLNGAQLGLKHVSSS